MVLRWIVPWNVLHKLMYAPDSRYNISSLLQHVFANTRCNAFSIPCDTYVYTYPKIASICHSSKAKIKIQFTLLHYTPLIWKILKSWGIFCVVPFFPKNLRKINANQIESKGNVIRHSHEHIHRCVSMFLDTMRT